MPKLHKIVDFTFYGCVIFILIFIGGLYNIKFISDIIKVEDFKKDMFNLVASGCGTGKSFFCSNHLLEQYKHENLKPYEILLLTSRAITVDQMNKNENTDKFSFKNVDLLNYWNGLDDNNINLLVSNGIQVMTYDKIINILISRNNEDTKTLEKIKVVVVDECHSLFSDTFIENMEVLKVWIRTCIYEEDKIFIGLTATPNILHFYKRSWGVKINQINKDVLVGYKAKQLLCTDYYTIPYLIVTNRIKGKTLIMCKSIKDCLDLQSKLANAAVLVSEHNTKYFTKEMKIIRSSIVNYSKLPDTFVKDGETYPLDILLTTSTAREGFNLYEASNVKNVICCFTDELHITQFMGRCRFNIDTLVVADCKSKMDNLIKDGYLKSCNDDFQQFIHNFENLRWFNSISHLVEHSWEDTKKVILGTDEHRFISYINDTWLVPPNCKNIKQYKIYKECDKNKIVDMAFDCRLFNIPKCILTFNRVMTMLSQSLGYEVETGRITEDKKCYTYKLVVSFDEEEVNFDSKIEGI